MKLLMGFIILLVALVAVTGCTQTASPSAQTTTATTAPTTEITTAAAPVATTVATAAPVITTTILANVTAPAANVTTAAVTTTSPTNVMLTPTPASMVTTIYFTSAGFVPQTDIVMPGTGVSFVNNDNMTHVVIATGNNTGMFNSGVILPKGAFPYTFTANTGTYTYALQDNASVTGTIIVQTPSGVTSYGQAS